MTVSEAFAQTAAVAAAVAALGFVTTFAVANQCLDKVEALAWCVTLVSCALAVVFALAAIWTGVAW